MMYGLRPIFTFTVLVLLLITSCATTQRTSFHPCRGLITIVADTKEVSFTRKEGLREPFKTGTVGNIAYVSKPLTDTFEIVCEVKDGKVQPHQLEKLSNDHRAVILSWLAKGVLLSEECTSVTLRCVPTEIYESDVCITTLRDRATMWEVPWQIERDLYNAQRPNNVDRSPGDTTLVIPFDPEELQANVEYPENMRMMGLTSKTVIAVLIDECGEIENFKLDSTQRKEFNEAALQAILLTYFKPQVYEGRPWRLWVHIPISFRIR